MCLSLGPNTLKTRLRKQPDVFEASKRFSFKKKNQKTFAKLSLGRFKAAVSADQSFFYFFFVHKKEVLSSLVGMLLLASPANAATISFCIDQANPMVAVDQAVANAATAAEGNSAEFVVRDSSKEDADNDDGNAQDKFFSRLAKKCDLILGFPVEEQFLNLPDGMSATRPYARTGFVAAATGNLAADFPTMTQTGKVGVVFLTPAETYFDVSTIAAEQVYYTNDELYGALLTGKINDALIWQPWLVHQLATHPAAVKTAFLAMPHTVWNVVGLYPQSGANKAAVKAFNAGVVKLAKTGKLEAAVSPYKIPNS
jgi:hypothetical protein